MIADRFFFFFNTEILNFYVNLQKFVPIPDRNENIDDIIVLKKVTFTAHLKLRGRSFQSNCRFYFLRWFMMKSLIGALHTSRLSALTTKPRLNSEHVIDNTLIIICINITLAHSYFSSTNQSKSVKSILNFLSHPLSDLIPFTSALLEIWFNKNLNQNEKMNTLWSSENPGLE